MPVYRPPAVNFVTSALPLVISPNKAKKTQKNKGRPTTVKAGKVKVEKSPKKTKKTSPEKSKKEPQVLKNQSPNKRNEVTEDVKEEAEEETDEEADEEFRELCYGSPWDATKRQHLKAEDLDLDKSYVEEYRERVAKLEEQKKSVRPERRARWVHRGSEPLTDISKLAEMGWDASEPDLDSSDLQGQIVRCKERIHDNIMPSFFEGRLERLEAQQAANLEIVASEKKGLSWPVLLRIQQLQGIEAGLLRDVNKHKDQLVNVRSILAAYRSQTLDWTGLVTYWVKGTQLSEPRPFNWDEYEAINAAHGRPTSFWVEGMGPLRDNSVGVCITIPTIVPGAHNRHHYNIALRFPGRDWWVELEFLYDTGAAGMFLHGDDLDHIAGPYRTDPVNVLHWDLYSTLNGGFQTACIQLEATLLDSKGKRMCPWLRVPCSVRDIHAGGQIPGMIFQTPRLDGGILRRFFYYMTTPDIDIPLMISDTRSDLVTASIGLGTKKKDRLRNIEFFMQTHEVAGVNPFRLTDLGSDEAIAEVEATRRPWPKPARGVD